MSVEPNQSSSSSSSSSSSLLSVPTSSLRKLGSSVGNLFTVDNYNKKVEWLSLNCPRASRLRINSQEGESDTIARKTAKVVAAFFAAIPLTVVNLSVNLYRAVVNTSTNLYGKAGNTLSSCKEKVVNFYKEKVVTLLTRAPKVESAASGALKNNKKGSTSSNDKGINAARNNHHHKRKHANAPRNIASASSSSESDSDLDSKLVPADNAKWVRA